MMSSRIDVKIKSRLVVLLLSSWGIITAGIFVGAIMELAVQFTRIQVLQELQQDQDSSQIPLIGSEWKAKETIKSTSYLFQLSWDLHVFVFGKQVHVTETVNGDEGKIRFGFAQMMQGMSKFHTIGDEEIDVFCI